MKTFEFGPWYKISLGRRRGISKQKYTLQSLPYGSVIRYRKQLYFKCVGLDGDMVMSARGDGGWYFIEDGKTKYNFTPVNWKNFEVLFVP